MKKIALCLMTICLSLTFHPLQSLAAHDAKPISLAISESSEAMKAKALLLRLDEINAMDKSNLKLSEKKNLRTEVRSIKNQLKAIGGGIYISAGGLLLIIILLIIFL